MDLIEIATCLAIALLIIGYQLFFNRDPEGFGKYRKRTLLERALGR
ncbi:MAG: hypothetical protein U0T75_06810 [Chitinophagales bacterium]